MRSWRFSAGRGRRGAPRLSTALLHTCPLRSGKLHSGPKQAHRAPVYVHGKTVVKKANNTMMEILSFASRGSSVQQSLGASGTGSTDVSNLKTSGLYFWTSVRWGGLWLYDGEAT